jgi:hypothetical protein
MKSTTVELGVTRGAVIAPGPASIVGATLPSMGASHSVDPPVLVVRKVTRLSSGETANSAALVPRSTRSLPSVSTV